MTITASPAEPEKAEIAISRAEAQQRMFQKLVNPAFFTDMRPLLSTERAKALTDETLKATFARVMRELIDHIPGDEWAKAKGGETPEALKKVREALGR